MREFDKWNKYNLGYTGKQAFEAGQQSQQAKIDELQGRIDEALTLIYTEKSKVECDIYKGVDADLIIGLGYELHLILKGNKDENN